MLLLSVALRTSTDDGLGDGFLLVFGVGAAELVLLHGFIATFIASMKLAERWKTAAILHGIAMVVAFVLPITSIRSH